MKNDFNIIIEGVGGQGLITLVSILDQAVFIEGHDIRSSELHGLSQRGGSVEIHVKFGRKIYSPLIPKGSANLIFGLDVSETLRGIIFANAETKVLANRRFVPYLNGLPEEEILKLLETTIKNNNLYLVDASAICKEKLQKEIVSAIYLLGYAVYKKLVPLKEQSVLKAIEDIIPEKYRELNIQAFKLAKETA